MVFLLYGSINFQLSDLSTIKGCVPNYVTLLKVVYLIMWHFYQHCKKIDMNLRRDLN